MSRYRRSLRRTALLALAPALVAGALHTGPADAKPNKAADLKVATTSVPAGEVKSGGPIIVTSTVVNVGKAKSKPVKMHYYLSRDKAVGKDVKLAGFGKITSLSPGKKATVRTTVVVPGSTVDGSYHLIACAEAKGKDKGSNNCRASATRATVRAPWKGTLTGTLTYAKSYQGTSTEFPEKSQDDATVQVKINVDESKRGWAVFGNAGSTYTYNGSYDRSSGDDWCTTVVKGVSTGGGPLAQVGDQYEDDIMGRFGTLNHSELDLLIGLRYKNTVTTKKTPVGNGCPASTTVDGPRAMRNLSHIEFHRTGQSGKTVTYKIHEVLDPYGTKTSWKTVTGTLTLKLK